MEQAEKLVTRNLFAQVSKLYEISQYFPDVGIDVQCDLVSLKEAVNYFGKQGMRQVSFSLITSSYKQYLFFVFL